MKTVLVIDDNEDLVVLFPRMIRSGGYGVFTATNAEEVEKVLDTTVPDIILLDLMMTPVDGWEILSEIRAHRELQMVPIVILTAKIPVDREISRHIGEIDDYIMKPVTEAELVRVLRETESVWIPLREELEKRIRYGSDRNLIMEYLFLRRELTTRKKVRALRNRIFSQSSGKEYPGGPEVSREEYDKMNAVEARIKELERDLHL
jgi:two-component system OmpR family response regulator